MAMQPCNKCGQNNWDYKKLDNDPHIYCTCKSCGNEIKFRLRKHCPTCGQEYEPRYEERGETRVKWCDKCGNGKELVVSKVFFKTIKGKVHRLQSDGEWHEVGFRPAYDKKGKRAGVRLDCLDGFEEEWDWEHGGVLKKQNA